MQPAPLLRMLASRKDSLPAKMKAIIDNAVEAASQDLTWKSIDRYSKDYIELQTKMGVKFFKTPDSVLQTQLRSWDQIMAKKSAEFRAQGGHLLGRAAGGQHRPGGGLVRRVELRRAQARRHGVAVRDAGSFGLARVRPAFRRHGVARPAGGALTVRQTRMRNARRALAAQQEKLAKAGPH